MRADACARACAHAQRANTTGRPGQVPGVEQGYEQLIAQLPPKCRPPVGWAGQHSFSLALGSSRVTVLLKAQAFYVRPVNVSVFEKLMQRPLPATGGAHVAWRQNGGPAAAWKLCGKLCVQ